MNAFLLAFILTGMVILDYVWDHLPPRYKDQRRLKATIVVILPIIGWVQAGVQYHNERRTDKDMGDLRTQLRLANASLGGINDGGDTYAEPLFSYRTNLLAIRLIVNGKYQLRNVSVKVFNETTLAEFVLTNPNTQRPRPELITDKLLGDISPHWSNNTRDVCETTLDPSKANYIRVDVLAANGFSWQIYRLQKLTNKWNAELRYLNRWAGDKLSFYPTKPPENLIVF